MSITVQLPKFEGPLGLLLYLIRKEEMDIMDIKIHEITKQYLDYIRLMKELDLEVAGEFIAMASTLIQIKSRMLLPQYNENGEIIEQEDPRKELVQKLLEYQKYQEAAKLLYDRPLVGRDVWLRGSRERLDEKEDEIILEDNALFSLISSYRKVLRSVKKKVHQVAAKAQSISSRILEFKERLIVGQRVTMMDLVVATEDRARQALITFLSLLELGKMGFVGLYQTEVYSDIWVDTKKPIETDVLSRVEEYDSMGADRIAQQMMDDAKKADPTEDLADIEDEAAPAEAPAQMSFGETPMDFTAGMSDLNAEIAGMDAELDFLENAEGGVELASDEEILAAESELQLETIAETEVEAPLETVVEAVSDSFIESAMEEQLEEQLEVVTFDPAEEVAVVAAEMVATSVEVVTESELVFEEFIDTDPKTEAEA
ncbi:segregation and condensation protein A [Bdellovibrio sp. HCB274]|uniref:segregation and condensation protein A n=1 Tax=Bdellovibrio sp. HCB274 TaxID=3394361 RepID=UPI0039B51AA6